MELWQRIWREGLAPLISFGGLRALQSALKRDDPRLIQGATTFPPALDCWNDNQVEAGCSVSFSLWKGDGLETVGEVAAAFDRLCLDADRALGEPGLCKHFFNWFDQTPREVVRRHLLREVELALAEHHMVAA